MDGVSDKDSMANLQADNEENPWCIFSVNHLRLAGGWTLALQSVPQK